MDSLPTVTSVERSNLSDLLMYLIRSWRFARGSATKSASTVLTQGDMIEVENLSKIYGSTPAIENVTFSVEAGEILGFLGPNGAGKTTTMRILAGYLPATRGTAKIAGYEVHENSMAVRQNIGYLPENPPLYPDMTVEGFLHFVARIKRVRAGDRAAMVDAAIQNCYLQSKRHLLIRKLSKGYRQRVGVAQAIVHNPPVIILDEPTVGLDPRQIIEVRDLIKNLAGDRTIILSTHILPEVSATCTKVTIINQGKVVVTNTPDNLMSELALGSGYELEVEPETSNWETVLALLRQVAGVRSVEIVDEPELAKNRRRIHITARSEKEPGKDIAKILAKHQIGLYEMRRTRASLEDVFLQLTTEENKISEKEVGEKKLG
jgi:ABC-2 type transport system ATP-binding protein